MALFNNKELEALQTENTELKDKIATLEVRLSTREKALSEHKQTIDKLTAEAEKYKAELSNSFPSHRVEKVKQYYEDIISKLEDEVAVLQARPHNERGAGRKHRATPEQRDCILSLFSSGISQNQIARMMTEQTGGKWNKTTVRNIIISAKN
jgi:predicted  nucleic acid-binding Zn-ribbon protein